MNFPDKFIGIRPYSISAEWGGWVVFPSVYKCVVCLLFIANSNFRPVFLLIVFSFSGFSLFISKCHLYLSSSHVEFALKSSLSRLLLTNVSLFFIFQNYLLVSFLLLVALHLRFLSTRPFQTLSTSFYIRYTIVIIKFLMCMAATLVSRFSLQIEQRV